MSRQTTDRQQIAPVEKLLILKDKDRKILEAICEDRPYKQVADIVHLSVRGVKWRLSQIYTMLGVKSIVGAVNLYSLVKGYKAGYLQGLYDSAALIRMAYDRQPKRLTNKERRF